MERRMAEALDRWLTTDPRDQEDFPQECPECGECEWVEVDCHDGGAWECHTARSGELQGDDTLVVCRRGAMTIYGHDDPDLGPSCDCDEQWSPTCEVHRDPGDD